MAHCPDCRKEVELETESPSWLDDQVCAYCAECHRYGPPDATEEGARKRWSEPRSADTVRCGACGEPVYVFLRVYEDALPSWFIHDGPLCIGARRICLRCIDLNQDLRHLLPNVPPPHYFARKAVLESNATTMSEAVVAMQSGVRHCIDILEKWLNGIEDELPIIIGTYEEGCPKCGSSECGIDTYVASGETQKVLCRSCRHSCEAEHAIEALKSFVTQPDPCNSGPVDVSVEGQKAVGGDSCQ